MTPEEAATASPEALKAADVETAKAMIAQGTTPEAAAAWLTAQNPAAFPAIADATAALS